MNRTEVAVRPIVCVPHAGAGASAYRAWERKAGPALTVVGLPGREAQFAQPALHSVAEMAAHVAATIQRRRLVGVTLFGHSLGALVAYEATRHLQSAQPGAVRRLVVCGCRSPTSPPSIHLSAIADDAAFMEAVASLGGLPAEAAGDPAVVGYLLPILRADVGAADAYRHSAGEPLHVPLLALGGDDDPFVPPQALGAWRDVAGAGFELVLMRGGHFFIFEHTDQVLRLLRG